MKNLFLFMSFLMYLFGYSQEDFLITGKITDENGGPIPYVTVLVKGYSYGTTTNQEGVYTISGMPAGIYTLKVSYLGYKEAEKQIEFKSTGEERVDFVLEEDEQALSEIVLTGVSRKTLIRENPIAVHSVSKTELELTSESNVIDVLVQKTPGLTAVKTGANISKPFIRGLGFNRVLTLYDGIRQEGQQWGEEHGLELDNYNIDRVEVIKGPAGIMYGSDALAGIVSIFPHIPKVSDGELHGNLVSEYHSNNGLIGNGLTIDYNDGRYLFSTSASLRMAKNYKNPVDGRVYLTNFKEKNYTALLGKKYRKGYTHLRFTLYDNEQGIPDGSRDSISRKFTRQIDEDDLLERPIVSKKDLNSYRIPDLSTHIQHYRLYLRSVNRIGENAGDFDLLLAGSQNVRTEYNHPEIPAQPGMQVRLNTLNYGLKYNAPIFAGIEASAGFNGMRQNNKSLDATEFPIPNYDLRELGTFLYAKWKGGPWTVAGGIRYDSRYIKWGDFWVETHPVTGFPIHVKIPSTYPDTDSELQYENTRRHLHGLTFSLGGTYRVTDQISMKANFGKAYRAPNITELASNGLDPGAHIIYRGNSDFEPEFSYETDFGFSANYPDFSTELSVFYNRIQNFIYLTRSNDSEGNAITDTNGNEEYHYLQSGARLYGGEFWFSLHPQSLPGFKFDNTLAYVNGENRDSEFINSGSEGGEFLPNIPPFQWRGVVSQTFDLKNRRVRNISSHLNWEVNAAQNNYFGLNDTETRTPGYTLFNLGVSSQINYQQDKALTVLLQANNLFNKSYQSAMSRLKYFEDYEDSPNGKSGIYDMGFNLTLKVIVPF